MNKACKNNLLSTCDVLNKLTNKDYIQPIKALSGATIGQHVSHIIEYYQCYIDGMRENCIDYDSREYCSKLETDRLYSIKKINTLCLEMKAKVTTQKGIIVRYNTSKEKHHSSELVSNSLRELLFCLEHSIHHQAMIKIALSEVNKLNIIKDDFGLSLSTVRYKMSLA
jgi:uncharacterized damage-inducible protein DinB